MQKAYNLIENTNDNLFITGKAGSGKTTFLRFITSHIGKRFMICAPTGVAAVNCHGVTLHHQFRIPFGFIAPDVDPASKLGSDAIDAFTNLFSNIDTIIIDEISMVRADVLDYVDRSLRFFRNEDTAFGGVQMIFMGDLFQIPPVVKKEEQEAMDVFYEGPYFFYAGAFEEKGFHVIEFSHVFRQKEQEFIDLLNRIRVYDFTESDRLILHKLKDADMVNDFDNGAVHICTHRDKAAEINSAMLGVPTKEYKAQFNGEYSENSCPCDILLQLRIGARVMSLINDKDKKYYNGSLGTVTALRDKEVDVKMDSGLKITFTENTWVEYYYKFSDGKVQQFEKGSCTQIPLALAWATTIHKSQGKQWDHVAIHIGHVFAPGMIYVALSRCTSLEGLVTDAYITKRHIIVNTQLKNFYNAVLKTNMYFDRKTIKLIV